MQPAIHKGALLAGAIALALSIPQAALARPRPMLHPHAKEKAHRIAHKLARKPKISHAMVAVTYAGEASKQASVSDSGFWLNGVSFDGAATFHRGLGVAADLSVVHAHDIGPNISPIKTTIAFGPRYTKDITDWTRKGRWVKKGDWFRKLPPSQIYGEFLFGVAHGSDGSFPEATTISTSANSFALQVGTGIDITLWHRLGARVFELDYIRTGLPNGAANNQNDLRLSFGVNYRFDEKQSAPTRPVKPDEALEK